MHPYPEWTISVSDFKQKYWRLNTSFTKVLADVHLGAEEELEKDSSNLGAESLELAGSLRRPCRGRMLTRATRQVRQDLSGHTGNPTANNLHDKSIRAMEAVPKEVLAVRRGLPSGNKAPPSA